MAVHSFYLIRLPVLDETFFSVHTERSQTDILRQGVQHFLAPFQLHENTVQVRRFTPVPQHGVVHRQPVRKVEPCLSFCGLGGCGRRHQFTGGVEHVRLHGQFFHPFQSVVHFGDYRQVRTSLANLLADIYPGRSIIQRRDASLRQQQERDRPVDAAKDGEVPLQWGDVQFLTVGHGNLQQVLAGMHVGRDFKTEGIETSHMFSYLLSVEFHFRLLARRLETQKDTFFHHRGRNGQGVTVRAVAPVIIGRRTICRIPRVRHVHLLPYVFRLIPIQTEIPFLTQKTLLSELPGHRNGQARAKHRQDHEPYF